MSSLPQLLPVGRPPGDVTSDATNSSLMSNGGFTVHDLTNKTWGLLTLQVEHRPLFHQSEPTLTPMHIFTSLWPEPRSSLRGLDLSSCVCVTERARGQWACGGGGVFIGWCSSFQTGINHCTRGQTFTSTHVFVLWICVYLCILAHVCINILVWLHI